MKKVEAIKRFEHGGKMFGVTGIYTVSDKDAEFLESKGRVKILEDLGKGKLDVDVPLSFQEQQENQTFLKKIKDNMPAIFAMFEEYARTLHDERFPVEEGENKNSETHSSNQPGGDASTIKTETDGADNSEQLDASDNKSNDKSGENKTELPERFPAKDKLIDAGIKFLEDIPRDREELKKALPELGDRSLDAIGRHLTEIDNK